MADIFDETIKDYEEEKKLKRYNYFLLYVSITTLVIIVAMVLFNYYQNRQARANQYLTEILFSLQSVPSDLDQTSYVDLIEIIRSDSDSNMSELASFKLATFYIQKGDLDKVIQIYDGIIKDNKTTIGSYFAIIQKLGILLDTPKLRLKHQAFISDFLNTEYEDKVFYSKFEIYKSLILIEQKEYQGAISKLNPIINNPNIGQDDHKLATIVLNNLSLSNAIQKVDK